MNSRKHKHELLTLVYTLNLSKFINIKVRGGVVTFNT